MAIALGKSAKEVAISRTAWKAADIGDSVIFRKYCPGPFLHPTRDASSAGTHREFPGAPDGRAVIVLTVKLFGETLEAPRTAAVCMAKGSLGAHGAGVS
ncbi:hypothetical protein ABZ883_28925 [Streptomyces sp. NPDC046977]|uniref:hypothetical protein n=1 Tax=Streptomyces sp. NPDC046977 TaxID=3154703 RepID=UPI0033DD9A3E